MEYNFYLEQRYLLDEGCIEARILPAEQAGAKGCGDGCKKSCPGYKLFVDGFDSICAQIDLDLHRKISKAREQVRWCRSKGSWAHKFRVAGMVSSSFPLIFACIFFIYTRFENTHEAIIDKETWELVQKDREQRRRPTRLGEMGMFSGLAYCADCEAVPSSNFLIFL